MIKNPKSICAVLALLSAVSCQSKSSERDAVAAPQHSELRLETGGLHSFESSSLKTNGALSLSKIHFVDGQNSLSWSWNSSADSLSIKVPVNYQKEHRPLGTPMNKRTIFRSWIYSEAIQKNSRLKFNFKKDGQSVCSTSFALNFSGWRLISIPYDLMEGQARRKMDEVVISLAGTSTGEIFFDGFKADNMEDIRWSWNDYQQQLKRDKGIRVDRLAINNSDNKPLHQQPLSAEIIAAIEGIKSKLRRSHWRPF
ncbi:MAG: hypothetical protein HRT88_22350, partial [Lentisphaeraceae bacterium]|nr:hypothetical protein [Lentisphaeraceae bacterium]